MSAVLLQPPDRVWTCPHCLAQDRTPWDTPNRFHKCRALAGITAPMIPTGSGARVLAMEREDYIGTEDVQLDGNGRPVMNITTERPDGSTDVIAFAPCATVRMVN